MNGVRADAHHSNRRSGRRKLASMTRSPSVAVVDDDIGPPGFVEACDDVRSDETGCAGDQEHPAWCRLNPIGPLGRGAHLPQSGRRGNWTAAAGPASAATAREG